MSFFFVKNTSVYSECVVFAIQKKEEEKEDV